MEIRYYGKSRQKLDIPNLMDLQQKSYTRFLQADAMPESRKNTGLEAVLREAFPIKSYDEKVSLDYLYYELGEPRYTPDECRALRLSYTAPLRIRVKFNKSQPVEEDVYLGSIPLMLGGGEFIINGAERVVVTQIHRSPGCDYSMTVHASGKRLHSCRVVPERGSWFQLETNTKDYLTIKIDRSKKMPATLFLRALDKKFSTDTDILRAVYKVERVTIKGARTDKLVGAIVARKVMNKKTGEVAVACGERLDEDAVKLLRELPVRDVLLIRGEVKEDLLFNTLQQDESESHEDARIKLYAMLRPGNPPIPAKANELVENFFDEKRFSFGNVGRFRLNRKFGHGVKEHVTTLTPDDFLHIIAYFLKLRQGQGTVDDIDHLANRRVRPIADLVADEFRRGLFRLQRSVRERMSMTDPETLTPKALISSQAVASAVDYFFARGELSQVVDQSNPLSQLTHERRLSALGPGGLNRKRAGFDVRDVHTSHYGRICPITTPEGTNIGLIVSLSIYAKVDEYGFLVTPYTKVKNGRQSGQIVYLRADMEEKEFIAQADVPVDGSGHITAESIVVRHAGEFLTVGPRDVTLMDVSTNQLVGIAAGLIPFLEHDDANRALMGSNMQRQAVPLVRPQLPIVGTGLESAVAGNSGMVIASDVKGTVEYADSQKIVVRPDGRDTEPVEYRLKKFKGLNERTCLDQKPRVRVGDKVAKREVLTDGAAVVDGQLALGSNILVAFMPWEGYNFEDAIVVSESLLVNDRFTSIHIETFSIEVRETKLGREEITRDIPSVSEAALRNLDEDGIIQVGTPVRPGDILVGKISPKTRTELSSEEKLLHAIFGRAGEDVRNDSLIAKTGCEGYVIDVQRFKRRSTSDEESRSTTKRETRKLRAEYGQKIADVIREKFDMLKQVVGRRMTNKRTGEVYRVTPRDSNVDVIAVDAELDLDAVDMAPATRRKAKLLSMPYDRRKRMLEVELEKRLSQVKRGDELPPGVLELVRVYVAVKRKLSVGDKLAGRHGNKGVISQILPIEDMPFLEDGTPVEMILNPLGVPSRMNFGQILETHLGWAAHKFGFRAVSPVFDGAKESEIVAELKRAGLPSDGKAVLYDGRSGKSLDQKVTVGYMYMMKLHHLVAEKVHARATGPYSLITQQPLGGKARDGGQRFGEMEVWALEAYGAAHTLQEMLTVKSDDEEGRTKIYESMVKGDNRLEPGMPLSFEVLMNEIRGLGLNIRLEKSSRVEAR